MNIYLKSKKLIYESAQNLNQKLENKSVRKVQRFTIIIFAILIVLDVVFVLPNPFPTFSRTVLDSSPKYAFIIWLWGIMTANIFFPRNVNNIFRIKLIGLVLMILISVVLYTLGSNIFEQSAGINCSNYSSTNPTIFTEVICYNTDNAKIDCNSTSVICSGIKYDITTTAKLYLLIFGFVFGYFLWPQMEHEPKKFSD